MESRFARWYRGVLILTIWLALGTASRAEEEVKSQPEACTTPAILDGSKIADPEKQKALAELLKAGGVCQAALLEVRDVDGHYWVVLDKYSISPCAARKTLAEKLNNRVGKQARHPYMD